ncbi:hypothetical protein CHS0354_033063 [Potamilus streckersoni]|uniref:Uncharacterized protein n=1 Tax=Potamilus streckersoni TaxID=2493646 RepID=A0AAE0SRG7_9BIVA|nr:hypothetical protein CHS0354_033063 [Potamilus streckersoni]
MSNTNTKDTGTPSQTITMVMIVTLWFLYKEMEGETKGTEILVNPGDTAAIIINIDLVRTLTGCGLLLYRVELLFGQMQKLDWGILKTRGMITKACINVFLTLLTWLLGHN